MDLDEDLVWAWNGTWHLPDLEAPPITEKGSSHVVPPFLPTRVAACH